MTTEYLRDGTLPGNDDPAKCHLCGRYAPQKCISCGERVCWDCAENPGVCAGCVKAERERYWEKHRERLWQELQDRHWQEVQDRHWEKVRERRRA